MVSFTWSARLVTACRTVLPAGLDVIGRHRLAELDDPVGRQRDRADRAQPREQRGHREIWQLEQPGDRFRIADHRIDLLSADDRAGNDRHPGLDRRDREPAAPETLQLIALAERLPGPFEALREDPDQFPGAQQPVGLLRAGPGVPAHPGQTGQDGHGIYEVSAQQPQVPVRGMLVEQAGLQHHGVERQHAGMVGDNQRRPGGGNMLKAAHPDPEPVPVEDPGHRHEHAGVELGIEAGLVGLVVAAYPPQHVIGRARKQLPPAVRLLGPGLAHIVSQSAMTFGAVGGLRRAIDGGRNHRVLDARTPTQPPGRARARVLLLLVPALNARLTQQFAVLLLRHPLTALLDH